MSLYSFRAECQSDLDELLELLDSAHVVYTRRTFRDGLFPDVDVELDTQLSVEALEQFMADVPDGHRMQQTLKRGPLAENGTALGPDRSDGA